MGGWGSGRKEQLRACRKATTHEAAGFTINEWRRWGKLAPGSSFPWGAFWWDDPKDKIAVTVFDNAVQVEHRWFSGKVFEWVRLDFTPCGWGGERSWFLCPRCEKRAGNLYVEYDKEKKEPAIACRRCLDLRYQSQREDLIGRRATRAKRIRQHLGGFLSASLDSPFPDRPKGMHRRTYERLAEEAIEAQNAVFAGLGARVATIRETMEKRRSAWK